jgi:hypothetical protein
MAGIPPMDPGTMSPADKSALGGSLGLETPPAPLSGAGVVPDGDLSAIDVGTVKSALSAAYSQFGAFDAEARDTILVTPAGSTATEGYHLEEQSKAIDAPGSGILDVGPVPPEPVRIPSEERA